LQYTTAINGLLLAIRSGRYSSHCGFCVVRRPPTLRQARRHLRFRTGRRRSSSAPAVSRSCSASRSIRATLVRDRAGVLRLLHGHAAQGPGPFHPLSFPGRRHGRRRGSASFASSRLKSPADGRMVFDAESFLSFAFICIFPSLLGYLFLNRGNRSHRANRAAPFIHLEPVFGSVLAVVLFGRAASSSTTRSATGWCSPGLRPRRRNSCRLNRASVRNGKNAEYGYAFIRRRSRTQAHYAAALTTHSRVPAVRPGRPELRKITQRICRLADARTGPEPQRPGISLIDILVNL